MRCGVLSPCRALEWRSPYPWILLPGHCLSFLPSQRGSGGDSGSLVSKSTELVPAALHFPGEPWAVCGQAPRVQKTMLPPFQLYSSQLAGTFHSVEWPRD